MEYSLHTVVEMLVAPCVTYEKELGIGNLTSPLVDIPGSEKLVKQIKIAGVARLMPWHTDQYNSTNAPIHSNTETK